ncbi:MAG: DMT family transporter [Chloroflexi bacterium]|nr:DMT family transporter [Chloroflexota bacterium]
MPETTSAHRPDALTLSAFFLVVLLGGSNSVAIRFSNQELAPFWGAAIRFGTAALVFWLVLWWRQLKLPGLKDSAVIAVNGFLSVGVSFALLYWALLHVPVSLATIFISSSPLFTFLLAGPAPARAVPPASPGGRYRRCYRHDDCGQCPAGRRGHAPFHSGAAFGFHRCGGGECDFQDVFPEGQPGCDQCAFAFRRRNLSGRRFSHRRRSVDAAHQTGGALVHKSKNRRISSIWKPDLGNRAAFRHTEMGHFIECQTADQGLCRLGFQQSC